MNILSDENYYKEIDLDCFPSPFQELIKSALEQQIISKEDFTFINIEFSSMPYFYHLLKVHKNLKCPPGRPIISGINSLMSNLSHYLDLYLQGYVRDLYSHLKDSDALIRILMKQPWYEDLAFLTMDVTSLYSKIDHNIGIRCIRKNLRKLMRYRNHKRSSF